MSKKLAAVGDLFFSARISEAAGHLGVELEIVNSLEQLLERAQSERPSLIIIDLNFAALRPVDAVRALKADGETASIPIVGYLSHVQEALKRQAEEAGCDLVLPRSAFSRDLAKILRNKELEARS